MRDKSSTKHVYLCSICGTVSIADLQACPKCGATPETGWQKSASFMPQKPAPLRHRSTAGLKDVLGGFLNFKRIAAIATIAAFSSLILPSGIYAGIAVIVLGIVGIAVYGLSTNRRMPSHEMYRKLLQKAGGDDNLVKRMIENERRRNPDAHIDQLMSDAIYRWERELK